VVQWYEYVPVCTSVHTSKKNKLIDDAHMLICLYLITHTSDGWVGSELWIISEFWIGTSIVGTVHHWLNTWTHTPIHENNIHTHTHTQQLLRDSAWHPAQCSINNARLHLAIWLRGKTVNCLLFFISLQHCSGPEGWRRKLWNVVSSPPKHQQTSFL